MTFTITGVVDSGGIENINCSSVSISPATPIYTWRIVRPGNVATQGTGPVASTFADKPGMYSCSFTATVTRDCAPPPHTLGPATAQSPDIDSVEWVTYAGNVALEPCPNNGGQRIFPDKMGSGDPNPSARHLVYLEARTSPAKQGCPVYFKIWDVDDPFDQNNPGMPDVALIDNDTSGPDNRPTPESPALGSPQTDASGKAEMTFIVSMQPGNNYRAGASMVPNVINSTTQTQADTDSPPQYVKFSDMLTVWRKLHVETDSMGAVDASNALTGTVNGAPTFNASNGHAVINVGDLDNEFEETDQHKPGRIDIAGHGSFVTVHTTTSFFGSETVEIQGAPANIVNANGASYTLWDDDAGSVPPFVMAGFDAPPVVLPRVPDTTLLPQLFNNAYILSESPDMAYFQISTTFDRNVANNDEAVASGSANTNLTSAPDFWAVHITSAFQGYVAKDGDPDTDQATSGLQYGLTGVRTFVGEPRSGSLIFLETIRDDKRGNTTLMTVMERYTVGHEVGHQFLLEHSDDRWPLNDQTDPAGDYIMTDVLDQTGTAPNIAFSANSINKIRAIPYPRQH